MAHTCGYAPWGSLRSVSAMSPVKYPRFVKPLAPSMPFPAVRAISSLFVPLCSVSPDKPLRSKSTSGADIPPKSQTSEIRFLLWGTPQNCASCTRQAMLHPPPMRHPLVGHFAGVGIEGACGSTILTASSSTAAKSFPPLLLKAPGTFSQTIQRGRTIAPVRPLLTSFCLNSFMHRICSMYKPERSPASPALFPATERS